MAAYYRLKDVSQLKDLGFQLSEGIQILPAEAVAPVSEATQLLEDARAQAQDIIRDAEREREEERQRGFEEGLQQGQMQSVELMLRQSAILDSRIEALEQELMNIVLVSMRKLVDEFDDSAKAEAVVRGALKQMRREKKAEIRISPEQLAFFRNAVAGLLADFPGFELIEIVEDATLSAPHVVVETSVGRIEGDLGSRLADFENIIRGILPGAPIKEDELITLDETGTASSAKAQLESTSAHSELDDQEEQEEQEDRDSDLADEKGEESDDF